jgi:hypothetical protein
MNLFLEQFLKDGWPYFYKVCLSFFRSLEHEILLKAQKDDQMVMSDILGILKLIPNEDSYSRKKGPATEDDEMSVDIPSKLLKADASPAFDNLSQPDSMAFEN